MATTKLKVRAPIIPASRDEVASAIYEIGLRQRERQHIEATMNDELAAIRAKHEAKAQVHAEEIKRLATGVQIYCETHREELLGVERTKTVKLATGEIRWRMRPPSVSIKGVDTVIEALERLGLARFVRVKKEVNKDAILAEVEAVQGIKGITVKQGEDFIIRPHETELEEIA